MKPEVQVLRKEDALMLLQGNTFNRPINKRRIERYRKEMNAGRWKTAGNPINIYDDGKSLLLLNGQHRLWSFVKSELETLTVLIVFEDNKDVFSTFDVGGIRTTGNILALDGHKNTAMLGAVARIDINMTQYATLKEPWPLANITPEEIKEWANAADPLILSAVATDYGQARITLPATNTWYAGLSYLVRTRSEHPERWLIFHEGYRTGAGLPPGSPILALRSYTINRLSNNGRYNQNPWDRQAHLAVGLKSWGDWLRDREVQYYKFSKAGLPMPRVR